MEIIFSCNLQSEHYGVYSVDEKIRKFHIFKDTIKNIVGFDTYNKFFTRGDNETFIEIGVFLDMLYQGSILSFEIINCPDDGIISEDNDFRLFRRNKSNFLVRSLLNQLLNEVRVLRSKLKDSSSIRIESTEEFGFNDYNRYYAYTASLYCSIIEDILNGKEYIPLREDRRTLQSIREGRFKLSTIEKHLDSKEEELSKLLKGKAVKESISKEFFNQELLKIRGLNESR